MVRLSYDVIVVLPSDWLNCSDVDWLNVGGVVSDGSVCATVFVVCVVYIVDCAVVSACVSEVVCSLVVVDSMLVCVLCCVVCVVCAVVWCVLGFSVVSVVCVDMSHNLPEYPSAHSVQESPMKWSEQRSQS